MPLRQKILVVENDGAFVQMLEATLRLMGTEPDCVLADWDTVFRIESDRFDCAFIDLECSHFDTRDLIRRIRHSKPNAKIPVVVLTPCRDTQRVAQAFEAGATFSLTKPVDTAQVQTLLNATRGAMLEERRKYERVALKVPVLCAWGQQQEVERVQGHTLNVSSSGLLMSLSPAPPLGSIVSAELKLPDSSRGLVLKGIVTRDGPAPQVAMRFIGLSSEQREALEKCVSMGLPKS